MSSLDDPEVSRLRAPVALIGTRLLRPQLLVVDFAADTAEIEAQA